MSVETYDDLSKSTTTTTNTPVTPPPFMTGIVMPSPKSSKPLSFLWELKTNIGEWKEVHGPDRAYDWFQRLFSPQVNAVWGDCLAKHIVDKSRLRHNAFGDKDKLKLALSHICESAIFATTPIVLQWPGASSIANDRDTSLMPHPSYLSITLLPIYQPAVVWIVRSSMDNSLSSQVILAESFDPSIHVVDSGTSNTDTYINTYYAVGPTTIRVWTYQSHCENP
jgi:hypothetical protein